MALTEVQQALLTRLAGENSNADASVADLFQQAFGDNPDAAPVLEVLRRRELVESQPAARQPLEETDESPPEAAAVEGSVADVLERLHAEVDELRLRSRSLAAALGACPRCWGEDLNCPRCLGRGSPGGRPPDPLLYYELVEPAVRRRTAQEYRAAGRCPPEPAHGLLHPAPTGFGIPTPLEERPE